MAIYSGKVCWQFSNWSKIPALVCCNASQHAAAMCLAFTNHLSFLYQSLRELIMEYQVNADVIGFGYAA
ncbi:hypothetical protein AB2I11_23870 [Escherichia coli]